MRTLELLKEFFIYWNWYFDSLGIVKFSPRIENLSLMTNSIQNYNGMEESIEHHAYTWTDLLKVKNDFETWELIDIIQCFQHLRFEGIKLSTEEAYNSCPNRSKEGLKHTVSFDIRQGLRCKISRIGNSSFPNDKCLEGALESNFNQRSYLHGVHING